MNYSSYNSTYYSYEYNDTNTDELGPLVDSFHVLMCIILSVGLPLTLVAIYAVYSLVQKDHVAPIYVINLLISDLIQFLYMIFDVVKYSDTNGILTYLYLTGLMASVCFMVCIAMERYLVIAWPFWYRHRRTVKISVAVCGAVWTLPVAYILIGYFWNDDYIFFCIFILLPLPLLTFFLGGTVKALSSAISISSEEKVRIVGLLVLVLLIYTLLFLPSAILIMAASLENSIPEVFFQVSFLLLKLSPLADLFMYVFLRKGAVNKLLSFACCRMGSSYSRRSTVNDETTVTSMKLESEKL